jgi:hypothetical protein
MNEERQLKFEGLRMIAKMFCETGTTYQIVRYFDPSV